jgi:UDP-glucose 4-epimerase
MTSISRVAVTGGCGFIGSHLTELLDSEGFALLVIDDLSHPCGEPPPAGADLLVADAGAPVAAAELLTFRPDAVVHLAARGGVAKALRDPAGHAQTVLGSSVGLMTAASAAGARSIVAASSGGAVYGDAGRLPADESLPPAPRSAYGAEKLAEEAYLGAIGRTAGVRTLALRFGNVYGARQDGTGEAGVVAITCDRLRQGMRPVVFGDGGQTRDFVNASDVATAVFAALRSEADGAINIGTGRETSVATVVETLCRAAGASQGIERRGARDGEVRRACLSIEAARRKLGWAPVVSLEAGLTHTWEWFEQRSPEKTALAEPETA